uniref:NADH-ubiquinone oxidoreductase chain 5 n=1 Tax=Nuttallina californica TaxID=413430 RepID=A0A0E3DEB6_9MOLL|nr:NADH dehydrogenase subunit 5 [Nuttallina californica]AIA77069.1 NADH dehydrogenase subunit 5 [Nuttallina californica]
MKMNKWPYLLSSMQAAFLLLVISSIFLVMSMKFLSGSEAVIVEYVFFDYNSVLMSFPVLFDFHTLLYGSIVCFISGCVMVYSSSYMGSDVYLQRFTWVMMLFVSSMNLFIYVPSLVSLLVGWDGLGLVSFCLVIYYQNSKSLGAGLMTVFMNRVGDCAILLGIGYTFNLGHFSSEAMWEFNFMGFVVIMILISGLTKSAQVPFSSWLPAAMAAPTPVSALVHSSTLVTAGVFLLIRFHSFLENFYYFNFILLVISSMTMVMAGAAALYETDLKKIIALSTLSQLGVMMFSISLNLINLALFHLFTHAIFKALLFLCAGNIIHCHFNNQDIRKMSFLWKDLPVTSTCFNIGSLALCGFPFLAGFYSKDLIIEMMMFNQTNFLIGAIMMVATMLTSAYSIRLCFFVFWSSMGQGSVMSIFDEDKNILFAISLLTSVAVIGGSSMAWLFFSPLTVPMLSMFSKTLALVLTLGGAFLMYKFSFFCENKQFGLFDDFILSMWSMGLLSNNFVSKPLMKLGHMYFSMMDMGWMELVGGGGVWRQSMSLARLNQFNQDDLFNIFFYLSFMSLFFCSLFMFIN